MSLKIASLLKHCPENFFCRLALAEVCMKVSMCASMSKSVSKNVCASLCKRMGNDMNLNESECMYEQECRYEYGHKQRCSEGIF